MGAWTFLGGGMSEFTTTPKLGLYKPKYNQDAEHWGDHLNANADTLDLTISGLSTDIGGPFLPIAGGNMGGPLNYYATGATALRSVQDRATDVANVLDFGADPTGVADSAPAINAALATGRSVYMPEGIYHIRSQLNAGPGSRLFGDGRGNTALTISGDFSSAATGVIVMTGNEDLSPILEDFSMKFAQPSDQGARANFRTLAAGGTSGTGGTGVMYPPAILSASTSGCRFKIRGLTIYAAWDGIKTTPNNAPWIEDVEMGALNCGLNIGQARDFCHIRGYHFWSFGITASTPLFTGVYQDGNVFAARIGESGGVNGLNVVDFCTFLGRVLIADSLQTWGHIANMMMDGNNATLEISGAAWLQISNIYFTGSPSGGNPSPAQLNVPGGRVYITNIYANTFGKPAVSVTGGSVRIVGGRITQATPSASAVVVSSGFLGLSNVGLSANTGAGAWTVPFVNVTATGIIRFQNNSFDAPSIGDAGGLVIATDNSNHMVTGNFWNGWTWTFPGTLGTYAFNSDLTANKPVNFRSGAAIGSSTGGAVSLYFQSLGTSQRAVQVMTGSTLRWAVAWTGGESGSNSGTDFQIARYNDGGTLQDTPLQITRATGRTLISNLRADLFGMAISVPLGRQTITGSRGGNAALASLLTALAAFGLITDSTTA